MFELEYTEFYITNVCNLSCENCNRFNNFNFKGHQRWDDYADIYKQWAEKLEIKKIGMLGGEPMLNPAFIDWVNGVKALWPNSEIVIITNGTQLDRWPELYSVLQDSPNILLEVNIHSNDLTTSVLDNISKFLKAGQQTTFYKTFNPEKLQRRLITDNNGVRIEVSLASRFYNSSLIYNKDTNQINLHNSDPNRAIEVCLFKGCHHLIKGKLYKCGPAGILPEFINQIKFGISDEDKNLINAYIPATITDSNEQLADFISGLVNHSVIPQCKFCPEKVKLAPLNLERRKIKISKA